MYKGYSRVCNVSRFKEQTLDIHLDPIKPHRGTTFILNTYSNIISKLLTYCKTRFVYHNLYINGEKSTHTEYDMLTKYTSDDDNKITTRLIGHIVDMNVYDPLKDVDKPLYIRGIYVRDIRTVFSYDSYAHILIVQETLLTYLK